MSGPKLKNLKIAVGMDAMKKAAGKRKVAIYTGAEAPPIERISTGSFLMDWALNGGLARGRMYQYAGRPSSGKCLPADQYVSTDKGLQTVGEVFADAGIPPYCMNSQHDVDVTLVNRHGQFESTTQLHRRGKRRRMVRVATKGGIDTKSTPNHPHLVMSTNGNWVWRKAQDLRPGDHLVLHRSLPAGDRLCDPDRAYALGLMIADGSMEERRIQITNDDPDIKRFLESKAADVFGRRGGTYDTNGKGSLAYHFTDAGTIRQLYSDLGLKATKSPTKELGPVMRRFDRSALIELLRGYMDCECHVAVDRRVIEAISASRKLITEVQLLLRCFGIWGRVRPKAVAAYPDNDYWNLTMGGDEARKYVERIGTRSARRQQSFDALLDGHHGGGSTNIDSVPFIGSLVRDLYESTTDTTREHLNLTCKYVGAEPRHKVAYANLHKILDLPWADCDVLRRLRDIAAAEYIYDEVRSVRDSDIEPVFDFTMEDTASFTVNGHVTHNSSTALAVCADVAANNGTALWMAVEDFDWTYAHAIGVPMGDSFALMQTPEGDALLDVTVDAVRSGLWDVIVVDSIGALKNFSYGVDKNDDFEKSVGERERGGLGAMLSEFTKRVCSGFNSLAVDQVESARIDRLITSEKAKKRPSQKAIAKWEGKRPELGRMPVVIVINQVRAKGLAGGPGGVDNPGGWALKHHKAADVQFWSKNLIWPGGRVEEDAGGKIRPSEGLLAREIFVSITKHKVGVPYRSGLIRLGQMTRDGYRMGRTDREFEVFQLAQMYGLIEQAGAWYSVGEFKAQGEGKFLAGLRDNPDLRAALEVEVMKRAAL